MKKKITSIDSERIVIGILLLYPEELENVKEKVNNDYFYNPASLDIFKSMCNLSVADKPIDIGTIADHSGYPIERLIAYTKDLPPKYHIKEHIAIMRENRTRRKYEQTFSTLIDDLKSESMASIMKKLQFVMADSQLIETNKTNTYKIDLNTGPIDWLIKDLIPKASCILVGAEMKTGKTWFAFDLAVCLASGLDPFGTWELPTHKKHKILIYSPETGQRLNSRRIVGLCHGRDIDPSLLTEQIEFISDDMNLTDLTKNAKLIQLIKDTQPDLMIVDPLINALGPDTDENSSQSMFNALKSLKNLTKLFSNMSIIVTHHLGKSQEGRSDFHKLRGSSALGAWADGLISISRLNAADEEERPPRLIKVELRDALGSKPIAFDLITALPTFEQREKYKCDYSVKLAYYPYSEFKGKMKEIKEEKKEEKLKTQKEKDIELKQKIIALVKERPKYYNRERIQNTLGLPERLSTRLVKELLASTELSRTTKYELYITEIVIEDTQSAWKVII